MLFATTNRTRSQPQPPPALILLLLALLLLSQRAQPLPIAPPTAPPQHSALAQPAPALVTDPDSNRYGPAIPLATTDPRRLPADLLGKPELIALRTPASATFLVGADQFVSVMRLEPMHYRDGSGDWQPILPAFRATGQDFVVEHNAIASRAGLRQPSITAAADGAAFNWRASALGSSDGATFSPLAHALEQPAHAAQQQDNNRSLHYTEAWDDLGLSEDLISRPGQIKQQLVLPQRPRASGTPAFLELRADLALLPGTSLWADGQEARGAVAHANTFELRNAAGQAVLEFAPVAAFEQARPGAAVQGSYALQPGARAGSWTVLMRTPWSWWADPARSYPAVFDPTIRVLTSTGAGTSGMAWVGDGRPGLPDTQDHAFRAGGIALGEFGDDQPYGDPYRGYLQFNDMPALLTNPLQNVSSALLDITPSNFGSPGYTYKKKNGDPWHSSAFPFDTTLAWFSCASGSSCPFNLRSAPSGAYTWSNRPSGTPIGTKQLVSPVRDDISKTTTTTWDVTSQIGQWYTHWSSTAPADGPLFSLEASTQCPAEAVASYTSGPQGEPGQTVDINWVDDCTRLFLAPADAQLRLSYQARPLDVSINNNVLNIPGVPSYAENVLESTGHTYALAPAGNSTWRAAAVRGNHAPKSVGSPSNEPPTYSGIKLLRSGATLAETSAPAANRTSFVLIDDHNSASGIAGASLQLQAQANSLNDYASDRQRNERVTYVDAIHEDVPAGVRTTFQRGMSSDELISLYEFDVPEVGSNISIKVTTSANSPLDLALITPTEGDSLQNAVLTGDSPNVIRQFGPDGAAVRSYFHNYANQSGTFALALINQGPAQIDPSRPPNATFISADIDMLICPQGTIATVKFDCQPIRMPQPSDPASMTRTIPALGLTIYSPGGFVDGPATTACVGATWSTTNEGAGTPLFLRSGSDVSTFVAQGSICWYNTATPPLLASGPAVLTTPDSGIGLTLAILTQPSRGFAGTLLYGDTSQYPVPGNVSDPLFGTVGINAASGGQLRPLLSNGTRRNFRPFDQYWKSVFTPASNPDYIDLNSMQAKGSGTIKAQVTINQSDPPRAINWQVPWAYYPTLNFSGLEDVFTVTPSQSAPLLDTSSDALEIGSMKLRLLGSGGQANTSTGIIRALDLKLNNGPPVVAQFRSDTARLSAKDSMGGATKPIQVVIQPPGMPRLPGSASGQKPCQSPAQQPTSCLDLREPGYDWANGDGDKSVQPWAPPDLHITGDAQTLQVSSAGKLSVFSAAHPLASPSGVSQSFSFDTWNASVSIHDAVCPGSGSSEIVSVLHGTGTIALPMIEGGVDMVFTLCNTRLNETKLTLEVPKPGIAVGSTGMGVSLIGGEISVGPDATQIVAKLNFQSLDQSVLTGGKGQITINTAGLFDLQASGKLVGELDATMHIAVAWNPLDMLVEADINGFGGLISGALRMHAWNGKGWQNKYPWLQDGKFYFTGSIDSTVSIQKGAVVDAWYFKLPPSTIPLNGVQIQFGEFCQSGDCTATGWGMSGVLSLLGFKVGLYVDSSGPDLFLGSSAHKLVDQFGGSSMAAAQRSPAISPAALAILKPGMLQPFLTPQISSVFDDTAPTPASSACSKSGTTHSCAFSVPAGTGRALFGVSWLKPGLDIELLAPDGSPATLAHMVNNTSTTVDGVNQLALAVEPATGKSSIASGSWVVRLKNVSELPNDQANSTNYSLLFAADPPAPQISWTAPKNAGTTPDTSGKLTLGWNITRGGAALAGKLPIELVYTPLSSKPITPGVLLGIPLASPLQSAPLQTSASGSLVWDTRGLASGEYVVGARIDDHQNGNAHVVAWAPGTVLIHDTTPPAAPQIKGTSFVAPSSAFVTWKRNSEPDLAGYLVRYSVAPYASGHPAPPSWELRILPSGNSFKQALGIEWAQLNGLLENTGLSICVAAYDASGNVGPCSTISTSVPTRLDDPLGAPHITGSTNGPQPHITWQAPSAGDTPAGYLVSITPAGYLKPGVSGGTRSLDVGNTLATNISGLVAGQRYRIELRAYTASGYAGPAARTIVQASADFSSWIATFGLSAADSASSADPDGDGLSNQQEYQFGSFPMLADSDSDGYDDGEAAQWGGSAGDTQPLYHTRPKLALIGSASIGFQASSNRPQSGAETLLPLNSGAGTLQWSAQAAAPWLKLSRSSGNGGQELGISADASGLAPGNYTTTLLITSAASGGAPAEQISIPIRFSVRAKIWSVTYLPLTVR